MGRGVVTAVHRPTDGVCVRNDASNTLAPAQVPGDWCKRRVDGRVREDTAVSNATATTSLEVLDVESRRVTVGAQPEDVPAMTPARVVPANPPAR
jgi:hypothetical protein